MKKESCFELARLIRDYHFTSDTTFGDRYHIEVRTDEPVDPEEGSIVITPDVDLYPNRIPTNHINIIERLMATHYPGLLLSYVTIEDQKLILKIY